MITFEPIGVIHTPFKSKADMPIQPAGAGETRGRVEVFARFAEGLADLEGFSHVVLLYHFHESEGYSLRVVPFLDDTPRGVFATRAPRRPNPIGLSVVRLVAVRGATLDVEGIDVLDETPLLDIKPHVPEFEAGGALRRGWLEGRRDAARTQRSDERFSDKRDHARGHDPLGASRKATAVVELDHRDPGLAEELRDLLFEAYQVEATLIGVEDFAPLRRPLESFVQADAHFLGIRSEGRLVALAELERHESGRWHIGGLGVRPAFFRRGLGARLVRAVIERVGEGPLSVSTAAANGPAIALYERAGFGLHERWETPCGIAMVTLLRAPG